MSQTYPRPLLFGYGMGYVEVTDADVDAPSKEGKARWEVGNNHAECQEVRILNFS